LYNDFQYSISSETDENVLADSSAISVCQEAQSVCSDKILKDTVTNYATNDKKQKQNKLTGWTCQ